MTEPTTGAAAPVLASSGGVRDRIRGTPGIRQMYRLVVFLAGALFVVLGALLSVLPGPLTIPPVLLGLWIWSTEFRWARRLLTSMRSTAARAWRRSRAHVVSSTLLTVGGLVAAGAALWAVQHFALLAKVRDALLP